MKTKQLPRPIRTKTNRTTQSGEIPFSKLQELVCKAFNHFANSPDEKLPTTVTQGDNWMCVASEIGDVCLSVNVMKKRR